jgi:mannose-P-dolichol utilization defect 1
MDKCLDLLLTGKFEPTCLQLLLSKALSFAIIFLSFTLKVPQIKNMLSTKSAEGLSHTAIYLEIIIFINSALYGYHYENPFSTYGENLVILMQSLIILLLTWKYTKNSGSLFLRALFLISTILYSVLCVLDKVPEQIWIFNGSLTIFLVSIARVSQIYTSFKNKDTGPLSAFTFVLSLGGTVARIFTTFTETKDLLVLLTYSWSGFLTLIIIFQIYIYGNKKAKVAQKVEKTD